MVRKDGYLYHGILYFCSMIFGMLSFSSYAMQHSAEGGVGQIGRMQQEESVLSCKHKYPPFFIFGALVFKRPYYAEFPAEIIGGDEANFYCPLCGCVRLVKIGILVKFCENWWKQMPLVDRLEALMVLPYSVFHKTVSEAQEKVEKFFIALSENQQSLFLKRFSFEQRIFYFKSLCQKGGFQPTTNEEILDKLTSLKKTDLLQPEDKFFLLSDEKRLNYFLSLESDHEQVKLLAFHHEKILDLKLLEKCLKNLCKKELRSPLTDAYVLHLLGAVWKRFEPKIMNQLFSFALKTAHPDNCGKYIINFWDEIGAVAGAKCVEEFIESENHTTFQKHLLLLNLNEKLTSEFYTKCRKKIADN